MQIENWHNKALVRTQTTLRFVCAAQLGRYARKTISVVFAVGDWSARECHMNLSIVAGGS